MAHTELSASIVTKNFMDKASLIDSKEDYNIYFICGSYEKNSKKFEPTIITPKYNLKLVTVYPPVSIDVTVTVTFTQSFKQENLYSKIIEELDIKKLSKNGDEFFIKVFNESGYIYFFLKKQKAGAAAATSAFYKKKSMKKKSMKKKSMKKKSMKKKSMKKKSMKKKSMKSMKKKF